MIKGNMPLHCPSVPIVGLSHFCNGIKHMSAREQIGTSVVKVLPLVTLALTAETHYLQSGSS